MASADQNEPPGKDPAAFRTIREVSEQLDVPQHVLRFWETRFPELKPLQRGGNRRYYRPADVAFAAALHKLLHLDGYTVKGVRKLITDNGASNLVAIANGEPIVTRGRAAAVQPSEARFAENEPPVRPAAGAASRLEPVSAADGSNGVLSGLVDVRNRLAAALQG